MQEPSELAIINKSAKSKHWSQLLFASIFYFYLRTYSWDIPEYEKLSARIFSWAIIITIIITWSVFKTFSNIYDGTTFQKQLKVFSRQVSLQKSSIVDVWQGPKYTADC